MYRFGFYCVKQRLELLGWCPACSEALYHDKTAKLLGENFVLDLRVLFKMVKQCFLTKTVIGRYFLPM